jgi:hypothetical protein
MPTLSFCHRAGFAGHSAIHNYDKHSVVINPIFGRDLLVIMKEYIILREK